MPPTLRTIAVIAVSAALGSALTLAATAGRAEAPAPRITVIDAAATPTYALQDGKLQVQVLVDEASASSPRASLGLFTAHEGASAPAHDHGEIDELVYILEGQVEMHSGGETVRAGPGMAVHIPGGVEHDVTVPAGAGTLRAVQVYAAPGPEQRFKAGVRTEP